MRNGVQVGSRNYKGERVRDWLRLFDFDDPARNDFLWVRELWVRGDLYPRRADIVGLVNGRTLSFIECKNVHRNLKTAFERTFADYKDTVPHLFHHNAVVTFCNGVKAKIGSITNRWEPFHEWKRLHENGPGLVDIEMLLRGVCDKRNFLDRVGEESEPCDFSQIDCERLKQELQRCSAKRTAVENLRKVIEQRLGRLLLQNPLRTDFPRHDEDVVAE